MVDSSLTTEAFLLEVVCGCRIMHIFTTRRSFVNQNQKRLRNPRKNCAIFEYKEHRGSQHIASVVFLQNKKLKLSKQTTLHKLSSTNCRQVISRGFQIGEILEGYENSLKRVLMVAWWDPKTNLV